MSDAVTIHPSVDNNIVPTSSGFAGGAMLCKCTTKQVKIGVASQSAHNHACRCTNCRKSAGALLAVLAVVAPDKATVVENINKVKIVGASATIQRNALSECGVHMFSRIEDQKHPLVRPRIWSFRAAASWFTDRQ